jgi:Bacterial regulatory proteins, luxR family
VISVRTVESHLYHVFRKLDVHTRDQLKELLTVESGTSPADSKLQPAAVNLGPSTRPARSATLSSTRGCTRPPG